MSMSQTRFLDGYVPTTGLALGPRVSSFPFASAQTPDAYAREHRQTYLCPRRDYLPRLHQRTSWSSGFTYTDDYSNAAWTKTFLTGSANQVANPADGAVTAGRILETTDNQQHVLSRAFTFTAVSHAVQFFARHLGRDWVRILANDGTEDFEGWVNLATGATKPFADIINATTLNGGMETSGSPLGSWSKTESGTSGVTRDTSVFASGTASCLLTQDGSGSACGIFQDVLQIGRRYRVTIAARNAGTGVLRGGVGLSFAQVLTTSFATYSVEFTAVADRLLLYAQNEAGALVYLDDVVLTPLEPAAVIAAGLLNGGMETSGSPLGSWSKTESGTSAVTRDTSVFASGTASCLLTQDGSGSACGIFQDVLQIGRRYRVTIAARNAGTGVLRGGVGLSFAQVLTTSFATYSVEFTAVADRLLLYAQNEAGALVYLDNVHLVPLDPPEIVFTACPDSPAGDWWRIALVLPWVRAAAGTVSLQPSSDGTTLTYAGDTAKGLYLKWFNCRPGDAANLGPAIEALGSARTVLAPDLDADDPFAYLVAESDPQPAPGDLLRVERTFARIPGVQTSYHFEPFNRPNMSGLKSGSILAASLDDGRSVHLWNSSTQLKAVLGAQNTPGTSTTNSLPSGNITLTLSDTTAASFAANATKATADAVLKAAFVDTAKLTYCYVTTNGSAITITWGRYVSGPTMASVSNPSGTTPQWWASGNAITITAFGVAVQPDTKTLYVPSHGGGVGDATALFNGDSYLAAATLAGIATGDYLSFVLEDLKSVDVPISHIARAAAATVRYAVGARDIRVRRQLTHYLPGVSMLADGTTLATPASIPATATYAEGQAWLNQLVAASTHVAIRADDAAYLGPIMARQVTAAIMAEAVDSLALV
jgi:hypothetical protein